ncbi:MAG: hypothetical protein FE041_01140 [Thermoplasmata archaeon]|nr:MAG: hypothetical protein FE041_01140 [Thermoplasmata archaeon]
MSKVIAIAIGFVLFLPTLLADTPMDKISGNRLFVGGSGEGNYTKIQDAINHASAGDTIFVYAGTYKEILYIYNKRNITIIGEDINNTIIDGNLEGNVINIYSCKAIKISNFTIMNSKQHYYHEGIYMNNDSYCEITKCKFINDFHGAIVYKSVHNKFKDCIFEGLQGQSILLTIDSNYNDVMNCNFTLANWTGVYVYKSKENTINSNFYRCSTAIYIRESPNNKIIGSTINFCGSEENVGMIVSYSDNTIIQKCNISYSENTGLAITYSNNSHISNCSLSNNLAGIALYMAEGSKIDNCSISDSIYNGVTILYSKNNIIKNTVSQRNGYPGMVIYFSSANKVKNCSLIENENLGIEIYEEGNNVVEYCNIIGNKVCGVYLYKTQDNTINHNNIFGNGWGLFANSSISDARYNYWGSIFGPLTFGLFGDGIWWVGGGRITFFPWSLTEIKPGFNTEKVNANFPPAIPPIYIPLIQS